MDYVASREFYLSGEKIKKGAAVQIKDEKTAKELIRMERIQKKSSNEAKK
jgi:hypothetical protein